MRTSYGVFLADKNSTILKVTFTFPGENELYHKLAVRAATQWCGDLMLVNGHGSWDLYCQDSEELAEITVYKDGPEFVAYWNESGIHNRHKVI